MTDESSTKEGRFAKFPGASRNSWLQVLPDQEDEELVPLRGAADRERPGVRVEQAVEILPAKLIEELNAAQAQFRAELPPAAANGESPPTAQVPAQSAATATEPRGTSRATRLYRGSRAFLADKVQSSLNALGRLSRRMRLHDLQRRYLVLLSLVHRNIFDRRIERLLFIKTPSFKAQALAQQEDGGRRTFVYQGPVPGKVLEWALSSLPANLKRYAFVDFRAGNGRTLLLAARHNFEHATGYAFDSESCEVLEMNLAQYSRSYMSCRDVRAVRGDRDGVVIPPQPAVLFFPDCMSASPLSIILGHVLASQERSPRPVYLIFENSGCERGLDQMKNFERVPLPIVNRVKAYLFSPAKVAVYRSLNGGGTV